MKATAKVAFWFAGSAVEIPTGSRVGIHKQAASPNAAPYIISGTLAGLTVYEDLTTVTVNTGSALENIPADKITAVDWKDRRYQDRHARKVGD